VQKAKENEYEMLLETDDIVLMVVIFGRYAVQIYQMVRTLGHTRNNRICEKKMKEVDLNNVAHSIVVEEHNEELHE
jgi:hypothetical protein